MRLRALLVAAFWLIVGPAFATNLGNTSNFGSTGAISITSAASVSAGTLVVVRALDGYNTITGTVTDSKSNTYTLARGQVAGAGASITIFYSFVATPLTTSDTITYTTAAGFSGSQTLGLSGDSIAGYSTYDSATAASNSNFGTTYSVTGAGAAAVPNEIYVCDASLSTGTIGAPAGWTALLSPFASQFGGTQVNAGTSALTCNGTMGSSWGTVAIVSFKPTAVVSPPGRMLLMGVGQ